MPIGIIAVLQTYRVIDEANQSIESALLGETLNAAAAERRIITRTLGIAESLALFMPELLDSPEGCSAHMQDVTESSDNIVWAGFIDNTGTAVCASSGTGTDLSQRPSFLSFKENPRQVVTISPQTAITKRTAILVVQPVFENGRPIGYISLTVPHTAIALESVSEQKLSPLDILTFDAVGNPLTSEAGLQSVASRIPASRSLKALTVSKGVVFRDRDSTGHPRIYTAVPLVSDQIFALALWPASEGVVGPARLLSAVAFPIIMWLTSLTVAFVAVHRLVIRHIRTLRRDIRAFTASRRIRTTAPSDEVPAELREVMDAFSQMTDQILRDEADQENLLHEKDVLLKEVHHRVKNNLQLIASITNMQIRKSKHPESKFMLKRLQDRVMGLATVHRSLYQANVFSEVRADELISDISRQLANSSVIPGERIEFSLETQPVLLYPDQAVPLSLLVTEAVTNAFKYIGRPPSGLPWVTVSLLGSGPGEIVLSVRNSIGTPLLEVPEETVSGLGSQLIGAFVMQLGGTSEIGEAGDAFEVKVTFQPADFTNADS
ncbi:sensor histidine kinase [Oceaniglobus roseus]|uniref:sensor histidine kinase n=1 Tax=Oceaniglobus roseus TaxID=1737570 RepID=UPI0012FFF1BC|nr:sensor histidine kinase [Kandeliimicrobium roseum]